MKTALQQYESNTKQIKRISLGLVVIGMFVYFMWSGIGGLIAAIGLAGLILCFLRR